MAVSAAAAASHVTVQDFKSLSLSNTNDDERTMDQVVPGKRVLISTNVVDTSLLVALSSACPKTEVKGIKPNVERIQHILMDQQRVIDSQTEEINRLISVVEKFRDSMNMYTDETEVMVSATTIQD